jgi:hypothetical protein
VKNKTNILKVTLKTHHIVHIITELFHAVNCFLLQIFNTFLKYFISLFKEEKVKRLKLLVIVSAKTQVTLESSSLAAI